MAENSVEASGASFNGEFVAVSLTGFAQSEFVSNADLRQELKKKGDGLFRIVDQCKFPGIALLAHRH